MKATTVVAVVLAASAVFGTRTASAEGVLGVPLDCEPGTTCFFQQYADMDPGKAAIDPFCRAATYNGHKGTDIRIPAMVDVKKNVAVLSLVDGKVLRVRDGEEDAPVLDPSDWPKFQGKDCGNGAIIDHGDGLEAQYCHMRKGSLRVSPGEMVAKGEPIGAVGSSGMAAFPHLHITVRKDDQAIEPFTGLQVGSGCRRDGTPKTSEPLWTADALEFFDDAMAHTMAIGIAGTPPDYDRLMLDGAPDTARPNDDATVGWGWFINLRKGDRLRFRMTAPDGSNFTDTTTPPLARSKAAYMQFAGRSRAPMPGVWELEVDVLRNGAVAESDTKRVEIKAARVSRKN